MSHSTATSRARPQSRVSPAIVLWASAFVLAGMILTQADRLGAGAQARAELVSQTGSYTVLTADGGTDEVLVLLDHRDENLYVYSIENQRAITLHERLSLAELFHDAKARRQGTPRRGGN